MKTIRLVGARVVAAVSIALSCSAVYALPTTQLYVANPFPTSYSLQSQGKITVFDPAANGPTAPLRTLNQPAGAWTLALDSAGQIYSQYFLYDNPTNIYSPTASGNDAPIFTAYYGSDSNGTGISDATGVATGSNGYFYKLAGANAGFGSFLEAYAPNSATPFAIVPLNNYEENLTVDGNDNVVVASANSLLVYAPHLAGGTPTRTISSTYANADAITYSKLTGNIYTAAGGASGATGASGVTRVAVFNSNASGATTPLRIISGAATGLKQIVSGLAVNPVSGEIYVMTRDVGVNYADTPNVVTVYAPTANGNAAPIRSFTDTSSQFLSSRGMAFSPVLFESISINAGGGVSGTFAADDLFTGGANVSWTSVTNTSLLSGAVPPANVLQNDREGRSFSYTVKNLQAFANYDITLYFVENYFTAAHKRVFNVTVNGVQSLKNFDVYTEAGARYKAIQRIVHTTANQNGEIVMKFDATVDQAKVGAFIVTKW